MARMVLTSGVLVDVNAVHYNIKRIINRVYKLLPMREQNKDWRKPLQILIEQICGMKELINDQDDLFFLILCKMKGLFSLNQDKDMKIYRRVIFECLGLLNSLNENIHIE